MGHPQTVLIWKACYLIMSIHDSKTDFHGSSLFKMAVKTLWHLWCHKILSAILDILQGSFRLCNWLSLWHLPPACWSTFWKLIFKHQLGCGFDILDSISSFFCILAYAIIYVLIHHIIFWLYLCFLNILYFFKYSCTNIFHRRSLCTFHWKILP